MHNYKNNITNNYDIQNDDTYKTIKSKRMY